MTSAKLIISLLSSTFIDMQEKIYILSQISGNKHVQSWNKNGMINNNNQFQLNNKNIENVNKFTYLGSIISNKGGSTGDLTSWIIGTEKTLS